MSCRFNNSISQHHIATANAFMDEYAMPGKCKPNAKDLAKLILVSVRDTTAKL
jgi:hypothetical protein